MVGVLLRSALPEHHLGAESKDIVKLCTGLIGTMAALVLGLLFASAKSSYDTEKSEVTEMSANVFLLDRVLAHYGPQTKDTRESLRRAVAGAIDRIWSANGSPPAQTAPMHPDGEDLYNKIHQLSPANDAQRSLQAEAQSLCTSLGRSRWLLFEQEGRSISMPLLIVLVFWLTTIFVSFGLFAPRNVTVIATLLVCTLSVSGAIFLILELDHPFQGLIQIPSAPVRITLAQLGR